MAEPRTKADLLDALRASGREFVDKLGSQPSKRFEEGKYEGGWNGRQILAHAAAIEWTYPRLVDIAEGGVAPANKSAVGDVRRTEPDEAKGVPTRSAEGGIDSYNERQVAKRADASVAELIDEFTRNRAATIAAVEAADDELFGREIRSAGGITGVLADVIYAVAVLHVRGHMNDIVGAE